MWRKVLLLILLLFLFVPKEISGSITRICKVKYLTDDGYSQEYKVEVTFSTGNELNLATNSSKYNFSLKYCLIWFNEGEVAIISISDPIVGVGDVFDIDDFQNLFRVKTQVFGYQVNSESYRSWIIIAKELGKFIDPRENQ